MKNLAFLMSLVFLMNSCGSSTIQSDPSGDIDKIVNQASPEDIAKNAATDRSWIKTVKAGKGISIKKGQKATVHYTGRLTNGKKFDSSRDRKNPFTFELGAGDVIQGWDIGVEGMKVGEQRQLTVSPELGYGSRDVGNGLIPANSTLVFDVELIKIN